MAVRRKFDLRFKETVLQYAEETSGEQAARFFNIDSKRIRYWRKQRAELRSADEGRARLSRDGRKKLSVELERRLSEWIHAMRDGHQAVSADMIKNKALEIYPTVSDGGSRFVASTGWLQKFLKRYNLSLRRRSAVTQEDPNLLTEKLVWFVDYVGKTVSAKRILEKDIITMDETVAWFDASSPTQGVQGQERSQLTIVLAAKADGTKLKPFIVFRGADGDEEAMRRQISGAVINTSPNGWINDALVSDWLETVVGKSNATPRLLVWDSQRSHVSVTAKLKHDFNITPAVIPRGCTEYVQAHNVMWNQPLKQNLHDAYDRWMAGDYQKEYTAGGDLKPPARRLLVDWVVAAWDKLDTDMIRESFKVCGLSVKSDGSEDDLIACFKEGQPCATGRDMLTQARQRSWENWSPVAEEEEDGVEDFYFEEEDEEELVFEEEEEDGDHTSLHCITHQDVKNVIAVKEEQQEWSSSVDQEDPEPPHIKEEEEELWSSQEGEQLQGLEEADITKFPFTPVPVKSEDDEEKPQSEGHHCGGPGPVPGGGIRPVPRDSHPDPDLEPDTEDKKPDNTLVANIEVLPAPQDSDPDPDLQPVSEDESLDCCETEVSDGDWDETREPQSGLNSPTNDEVSVSEKPFSCSQCGKRFGFKSHLKIHMVTHTGEKSFSCAECGKGFGLKASLKRHMRSHRQEKPYSCSICQKSFTEGDSLRMHMRIHTGEKPFSCPECGRRFGKSGNLKRHVMTHTGEKPFSCPVCQKCFTQRGVLRLHMRVHTGEKPFSCSVCGKSFPERGNLRRHSKIHTGEKPFACSVCGKGFITSRNLKRHLKTHAEEKNFSCPVCEKSFSQRGVLQLHIGIHAGENPFSCSLCGKGFTESRNLKRHLKTHSGEKPFSCTVCGKGFIEGRNLKRHMRTHTGEKPFSCSACGKGFIDSRQMKIHKKIHTGEKPYSCTVCGKKFVFHINHMRHMRIHTGEKRFSCSICDQRFTWVYQLRNHQCVGRQLSQLCQPDENRGAEVPAGSSMQQRQQMETEADGEDWGGPQPARNSDPDPHFKPDTVDKTGDSSEPETEVGRETVLLPIL